MPSPVKIFFEIQKLIDYSKATGFITGLTFKFNGQFQFIK